MSALHVYPVKSLRGVAVDAAHVERQGLRHDRRWMVVDDAGAVLTARSVPGMLAITARPDVNGDVELFTRGRRSLHVAEPRGGRSVPVGLSRVGTAVDAGGAARSWLTAVLGRAARLVWLEDPARRTVSPADGGRDGDVLSLADAGPLLLASAASLRRLDRWVADGYAQRHAQCGAAAGSRPAPLVMERFRPNVVVEGDLDAFVEDTWRTVQVGPAHLRVTEQVDRCVVTTLEPTTGQRTAEPLRTLSQHRRREGKVWFGIRLVPHGPSTLALGDPVLAQAAAVDPADHVLEPHPAR